MISSRSLAGACCQMLGSISMMGGMLCCNNFIFFPPEFSPIFRNSIVILAASRSIPCNRESALYVTSPVPSLLEWVLICRYWAYLLRRARSFKNSATSSGRIALRSQGRSGSASSSPRISCTRLRSLYARACSF